MQQFTCLLLESILFYGSLFTPSSLKGGNTKVTLINICCFCTLVIFFLLLLNSYHNLSNAHSTVCGTCSMSSIMSVTTFYQTQTTIYKTQLSSFLTQFQPSFLTYCQYPGCKMYDKALEKFQSLGIYLNRFN